MDTQITLERYEIEDTEIEQEQYEEALEENKLDIVKLTAETLILKHCPNYTFKWDNAKSRFGCCSYTRKTISLSKHLCEINDLDRIKNTILHEIAHALTEGHHHDHVWKAKAIELGCTGARCYSEDTTKIIKGKYVYCCPNCDKETTTHRAIKRERACGECCKTYNRGRFSKEFIVEPKNDMAKMVAKCKYCQSTKRDGVCWSIKCPTWIRVKGE